MKPGEFLHKNCRNVVYPQSHTARFPVPEQLILWSKLFPNYCPPFYESPVLKGKRWADLSLRDDKNFKPKWNKIDECADRTSFSGNYQIDSNNSYPLNPFGRTGIIGRGLLGRWGPNHAADSFVTRWAREEQGTIKTDSISGRKILQMIAIQRRDNNMWAMPGGMVECNESASAAAKREFTEEALKDASDESLNIVSTFFDQNGNQIYAGYVDDPRNTDNAWMETVAFNFHDDNGDTVRHLQLKAGDDAKNFKWIDLDGSLNLYASHKAIVEIGVKLLDAHW